MRPAEMNRVLITSSANRATLQSLELSESPHIATLARMFKEALRL